MKRIEGITKTWEENYAGAYIPNKRYKRLWKERGHVCVLAEYFKKKRAMQRELPTIEALRRGVDNGTR